VKRKGMKRKPPCSFHSLGRQRENHKKKTTKDAKDTKDIMGEKKGSEKKTTLLISS
jgi:hypothetical protein